MQTTNRQWLLKRRPKGMVSEQDFYLSETQLPAEKDLLAGQALVKVLFLSFDPAMRGWMDDEPSYLPPAELDKPMRATGVGKIIFSKNPDLPLGALVQGFLGWQEYCLSDPSDMLPLNVLPEGTPPSMALSVFGGTSFTAYFGLLEVGQLKSGDTVLVSGAAGATGSVAAQIAKIKGCRVIGVAGGAEKCQWLQEECGLDAAIDYKNEDISARVKALCPDGVNLFFDNVGGEILEVAIENIAERGRIVLCGQIASYNLDPDAEPNPSRAPAGPRNLFKLIAQRATMQGFILLDYLDQMPDALAELVDWVMAGKIAYREDIAEGFEHIPQTFLRLFSGANQGKQLLKLSDD